MQLLYSKSTLLIGADYTAYIGWAIGSVLWVSGFIYVNQHGIDCYASTLTRSLALILFNLPGCIYSGFKGANRKVIPYLVARHLLQAAFGYAFAESFFYLPINLCHTLYSSGPFFVLCLDFLVYGVTLSARQMRGLIISFCGLLLIIQGPSLYKWLNPSFQFTSDFQNYRPQASSIWVQTLAVLIMLLFVVGWAVCVLLMRKIRAVSPYITHYQLNLHLGITMMAMAGALYPRTSLPQQQRSHYFWACLLFQGTILALCQAFLTKSLTHTSHIGVMSMINFLGVGIGYLLKLFRYHQPLNWVSLAGCLTIMLGVSLIVLK